MNLRNLLILALSIVFFACSTNKKEKVDAIYYGGDILTMKDKRPEYVESIVVKDGVIVFVGKKSEADKNYPDAQLKDLIGQTLLPGFIDAHSHFMQSAIKLNFINLDPPPAGKIRSIEEIKTALKDEIESNTDKYNEESDWVVGWGFDNALLDEQRFPNRNDLDQVSTDFPVVLLHFSGHMMVMNSKGLERCGYTAKDYTVPEGGILQYFEGSDEINGIIEEQAMLTALEKIGEDFTGTKNLYTGIPLPDDQKKEMLLKAQKVYASEGYTTITDFATTDPDYKIISELGDSGQLYLDVAMTYYTLLTTPERVKELYSTEYNNRYRVMGAKLNLDGGSPGRTAYLREPYHTPTPGQPADYRGYSSIKEQKVMNELMASYYELEIPFFIHALGDAAVDQCIEAVKYSEKLHKYKDARTQIIHAQQVQPDQFETLKNHDVTFTFQITHNYYFSDFHNEFIYGPERTNRLNPMKEALDNGFSVTFHHDSPVHPIDQMYLIWIAVNRESRSGKVYGEEQRFTPYEALYATTLEAAYQFKEENTKGSLEVGKLADLVILSDNPLKIDPIQINSIDALETIKEGKTVFKK